MDINENVSLTGLSLIVDCSLNKYLSYYEQFAGKKVILENLENFEEVVELKTKLNEVNPLIWEHFVDIFTNHAFEASPYTNYGQIIRILANITEMTSEELKLHFSNIPGTVEVQAISGIESIIEGNSLETKDGVKGDVLKEELMEEFYQQQSQKGFLGMLKENPMTYDQLQDFYGWCYSKVENRKPETFTLIKYFFDLKFMNDKDVSIDPILFKEVAGEDGLLSLQDFLGLAVEDYEYYTKKFYGKKNDYNLLEYKYRSQQLKAYDGYCLKKRVFKRFFDKHTHFNDLYYLIDSEGNIFKDNKENRKNISSYLEKALDYIHINDNLIFYDVSGNEINLKNLLSEIEDKGISFQIYDYNGGKGGFNGRRIRLNSKYFCPFVEKSDALYCEGIPNDFVQVFVHEMMHANDFLNSVNGHYSLVLKTHEQTLKRESYAEGSSFLALSTLVGDKIMEKEINNYFEGKDSAYGEYEKIFLNSY